MSNRKWKSTLAAAGVVCAAAGMTSAAVAEEKSRIYEEVLTALQKSTDEELLKTLGYACIDINDDGTPELLIGEPGDTAISELYAYVNGEATQIFSETDSNTYSLSEKDDVTMIRLVRTKENKVEATNYYVLEPDKETMTLQVGFVQDEEQDTENPYYLDYGLCELQPSDESKWQEKQEDFSDAIEITYESIENYSGDKLEAVSEAELKPDVTFMEISQETALEMMQEDNGHLIVDVRRQDEYDAGHIPGAILVPNESIGEEQPEELPDKDQILLIYCRSGNRSKQAAQKLADMGYTQVFEFGGINSWTGETEK